MSKSYTVVKRVIVPMLTALVLASQAAPAFALNTSEVASLASSNQQVEVVQVIPESAVPLASGPRDPSDFIDWNDGSWWNNKPAIVYSCIDHDYIQGMPVGDGIGVAGNSNISLHEFAIVLARMTVSQADKDAALKEMKAQWVDRKLTDQKEGLAEGSWTDPVRTEAEYEAMFDSGKIGGLWFTKEMFIAEKYGILDGVTASKENTDPCTRSMMATLLVNALKVRGEDISKVDALSGVNAMSDSNAIATSGNSDNIGTAIAVGLIAGDDARRFRPDSSMTRGEAAELFHRLAEPSIRAEILKTLPVTPSANANQDQFGTAPITIDMSNPVKHRIPQAGDTVIRPDGTSVVLAVDPATGVLGWGQNCGAWLGTSINGGFIEENTFASNGGLSGGHYSKCDLPGYEYTYLWDNEWKQVKKVTYPGVDNKGTDGSFDSTGLWQYSSKAAGGFGNWLWQGPVV